LASSISLLSSTLSNRVVLALAIVDRDFRFCVGLEEQLGEVEAVGLPVIERVALVEPVGLADQFVEVAERPFRAISSRTSSATKKK
jgi:hypothetical protein